MMKCKSKTCSCNKKYIEKHSKTFEELAKGPKGEYTHSLEEKLRTLTKENKRLEEENKELKTLLKNLR